MCNKYSLGSNLQNLAEYMEKKLVMINSKETSTDGYKGLVIAHHPARF